MAQHGGFAGFGDAEIIGSPHPNCRVWLGQFRSTRPPRMAGPCAIFPAFHKVPALIRPRDPDRLPGLSAWCPKSPSGPRPQLLKPSAEVPRWDLPAVFLFRRSASQTNLNRSDDALM